MNAADDFSDHRIFLCRPNDPRLAHLWGESGGYEQSCDGPTFIVIGQHTTNERCAKLAALLKVNVPELIDFRSKRSEKTKQLLASMHNTSEVRATE